VNNSTPDLILFLGRFHPVLVHLPIGFFVLIAAVELLALLPRARPLRAFNGVALALAVPVSCLSALCGWLLSRPGGYDPALLAWHQYLGFGIAAASLVTWIVQRLGRPWLYRGCLTLTCAAVALGSHFGGSLTHGRDYLTAHAPTALRALLGLAPKPAPVSTPAKTKPAEPTAFAAAVAPVLSQYCVGCHGPEKAKGQLRVDSFQALMKGGESGPVLTTGKGADSPLVKRLRAPLSDDNHMPPEGKPQPTPDELALIQWWIDAGATPDKTPAELNPPDNLRRLFKLSQTSAPEAPSAAQSTPREPKTIEAVTPLAAQIASQSGISISLITANEPWLQANASLAATNFTDADLARLIPLADNLRSLDLGGTRVSDAGLTNVARMKRLTRLHLERTGLTDAGLPQLTSLADLEYLNLYATHVTDAGLASLKPLRNLRKIYLWQTSVSPTGAAAFRDTLTDHEQIHRWQEEIASLTAKIRSQTVLVETGMPLTVSSPAKLAINTNCPVSGKPVDSARTKNFEGQLVAFCCSNCLAAFEKDPKPYLAKLGLDKPASAKKETP
jgi:uncharacterized membrane protein